jgi:protein-disulfide isomerase
MIRRRFEKVYIIKGIMLDIRYLWERRYKFVFVFSVFLTGIIITTIYFPHYWHFEMPDISANITKGVTKDGHPWIGAEKPELEITEFADYQCFQCKKMHFFLRQAVADNPDRIRLTHRHYPMDHEFNPTIVPEPFHVGSGKMALLAIYALEKGKFWEMNDALFTIDKKKGQIDISKLSQDVGVDRRGLLWAINSKVIQHKLSRDIWEGMRLKITGTPAYVINGEVYLGHIPPEVFKKVLD